MDALTILALAKAGKAGGGSDPQVVFIDVTYDMLQNIATSDTTQSDIAALLEDGKYPIAKVHETNTNNIIYALLTAYDNAHDLFAFDVVFLNGGGTLMHAILWVKNASWTGGMHEIVTQSPID